MNNWQPAIVSLRVAAHNTSPVEVDALVSPGGLFAVWSAENDAGKDTHHVYHVPSGINLSKHTRPAIGSLTTAQKMAEILEQNPAAWHTDAVLMPVSQWDIWIAWARHARARAGNFGGRHRGHHMGGLPREQAVRWGKFDVNTNANQPENHYPRDTYYEQSINYE